MIPREFARWPASRSVSPAPHRAPREQRTIAPWHTSAEAARIYAQAAQRDPGFYAFQRSLEAYRQAFAGGDSVIVLERNDPFLQYMRSDR